jgi:DNA-binding NarL/FixJ family response regulator
MEQAKKLRPDLILMDLAMPQLNGAEASSMLKQIMPQVPIVLFTMYNEAIGTSLASAIGIDVVVSKPDGIGKLMECVQTLLPS